MLLYWNSCQSVCEVHVCSCDTEACLLKTWLKTLFIVSLKTCNSDHISIVKQQDHTFVTMDFHYCMQKLEYNKIKQN